ncbi:hypothetical protein PT974_05879 [Cladobotryum mycophilum]|uniref:FAR-17a/AIG1-like protein n=1 Tax=Cladobotryum mycophilum TaxID=491253 RepID=A0ABR0SK05_9HYPO
MVSRLKEAFSFGTDLWDPSQRFETSWLLSPWLLFICRAIIGTYALTTRLFIIGWTCTHEDEGGCRDARESFSYFTVLTYWGLAFYFIVSALHTLTYALRTRPLLDRLPRPLQALHSLFYTTIIAYPFLVSIVYWGVIYGGGWYPHAFSAWSNISQHGLNSAFALFEILIPRTNPPPFVHIPWLILILAGYLSVAYITKATQGFYTYSFLDYKAAHGRGYVAAYIIGIAAGIVIVFLIVRCLVWVRRWFTEKKLGKDGKFARQRDWSNDAEMNTIGQKYPDVRVSGET